MLLCTCRSWKHIHAVLVYGWGNDNFNVKEFDQMAVSAVDGLTRSLNTLTPFLKKLRTQVRYLNASNNFKKIKKMTEIIETVTVCPFDKREEGWIKRWPWPTSRRPCSSEVLRDSPQCPDRKSGTSKASGMVTSTDRRWSRWPASLWLVANF